MEDTNSPCYLCGTQRCYPQHCESLKNYEKEQEDGKQKKKFDKDY